MAIELGHDLKDKPILHLNARNLLTFPEELRNFGTRVIELYIRWNGISTLPQWVGTSLQNLTNIYLSYNSFSNFPSELCQLHQLEVLHLDGNQITWLPPTIQVLQRLSELSLNNNLLTCVPKELGALQYLRILLVTDNQLSTLPDELAQCSMLEELSLDRNKIVRLPRALVYLPHLRYLGVSSNLLTCLPGLPFYALPFINLAGNPHLSWVSAHAVFQRHGTYSTDWKRTTQLSLHEHLNLPVKVLNTGVTSLLEMCLQVVYNSFKGYTHSNKTEVIKTLILPHNLYNKLEQGPEFLCMHCTKAVFSEAVVHAFQNHYHPLWLVFYCSHACANKHCSNK